MYYHNVFVCSVESCVEVSGMSTTQTGNSTTVQATQTENEDRLSLLKKASEEHYNKGTGLKAAAKKHGLGIKELKDFYNDQYGHDMMHEEDSDDEF